MIGNFDLVNYLIGIVVILLSVSVHEYAHARAAYGYGDDTAAERGRLTLNPLVHFEPFGFILILLRAPIAWGKPVPVNPNRFRRDVDYKKAMLWVSLSGVTANLILAIIGAALYYSLWAIIFYISPTGFLMNIMNVLMAISIRLITQNVYLAVFNLLPIPPLDGFEWFSRLIPRNWSNLMISNQRNISMIMMMVIVFFNGPFSRVLSGIANPIISVITWPFIKILELIIGV